MESQPPLFLEKFLANEAETHAFGAEIATYLRAGDIVKFTGPLGAGKTTLIKGIVAALGGNPTDVHSPTFSLVHQYDTPSHEVMHCDFYRLPNDSTLPEFGGLEFFESDSIFLIEWAERVKLFKSTIPNRLLEVDLRIDAGGRALQMLGSWLIVD